MPVIRLGLPGPTYTSESVNVDAQRSINFYPETVESGRGAAPIALYPTPGLTPFCPLTGTYSRGLYEFNGRLFAVGTNFAEVFADGTSHGYTFLPDDGNPVTMAANNANQLIICGGGQLWLFPLAPGSIIYSNVKVNVSEIQIVDNGTSTQDYYITCATTPEYSVGSTITFESIGTLAFLSGLTASIIGISGNIIHVQLPSVYSQNFVTDIASIVIAGTTTSGSPSTNVGSGAGWNTPGAVTGNVTWATYDVIGGNIVHGEVVPAKGTSSALIGTNCGFDIPADATILGVQVSFQNKLGDLSGELTIYTQRVALYNGGQIGNAMAGALDWTTVANTETYGDATETWGATLTPAVINNPGFGFLVQAHYVNNDSISHPIDANNFIVKVWYSVTVYDATVTLTQECPFNTVTPIGLAGLTHATQLNGNSYTPDSVSGSTFHIASVPGPAYSGTETGTATSNILNYGPTTDTGDVSGTVVSMTTDPVQVATDLDIEFSQIDFIDGYFVALQKNSQKVYWSGLEDGTSWNGADVFQVSVFADNLTGIFVDHKEIWCFGSKKTIPYYDSGDADNPFQPIPGSLIEQGSGAQYAPVRMDNTLFWIGRDERGAGIAWKAQGYVPVRVSNHAVENTWRQYSTISDAVGYSYQENGHIFWVIYFPSASRTWVYDAATGQWHEREFWNVSTGVYTAHRSRTHAWAFGKHIVGDISSANLYEMSIALLTDNMLDAPNNPIRGLRRAPHINNKKLYQRHLYCQVDCETGTDPNPATITLRWSDDGGHSWSDPVDMPTFQQGEYGFRVKLNRLGRTRDRVYELTTTSRIRIVDAYLDIEQ